MPDTKYYGLLTTAGENAVAEAFVSGEKLKIAYIAAGDGAGTYYQPTANMTELRHEVWRGDVISLEVGGNVATVKGVIPNDAGGFWVREIAAFASDGKMIAIANTPDVEKVVLSDGVAGEMEIEIRFIVSHSAVLTLTADSMVWVTRPELAAHNNDPDAHNGRFKKLREDFEKRVIQLEYRIGELALALDTGFAGAEVVHSFLSEQRLYWLGYDGSGAPEGVLDKTTCRVTA